MSVRSVFSVWDKIGHTELTELTEREASKGHVSVLLWLLCGIIKNLNELTERVVPK